MMRAVNPWSFVAALAVVSLSSCGLPPEKEAVIVKARSIREFPVSRGALVASLGLEKQRGDRMEGGIRGGYAQPSETWQHPTGLTITAYCKDYAPDHRAIDRKLVDDFLNGKNPDLNGKTRDKVVRVVLPGLFARPSPPPPSRSFDSFLVKDGRKVLFRSGEPDRDS